MPTRNVNLTDELDRFVLAKSGKRSVRECERGSLTQAKLDALRGAIDVGDSSRIVDGDVFERVRGKLHLPLTQPV